MINPTITCCPDTCFVSLKVYINPLGPDKFGGKRAAPITEAVLSSMPSPDDCLVGIFGGGFHSSTIHQRLLTGKFWHSSPHDSATETLRPLQRSAGVACLRSRRKPRRRGPKVRNPPRGCRGVNCGSRLRQRTAFASAVAAVLRRAGRRCHMILQCSV